MRAILLAAWLVLSLAGAARADALAPAAADDRWTDTERWAWQQIAAGSPADFASLCHTGPAMPGPGDPAWADPCRAVSGAVLEQMLTRAPWSAAMQHRGLWLIGAHVTGGLDLADAHVTAALSITQSHIDGVVRLARARFDDLLAFDGSVLSGEVNAWGLQSDADVSFADGRTLGPVITPQGGLATEIAGAVNLHNARIKGSLLLNRAHFGGLVDVSGAHVDQEVLTGGARFAHGLLGGSVAIGLRLAINAAQFAGDVVMPNASIGGVVDASGSRFASKLNLVDSHIAGNLFLNAAAGDFTAIPDLDISRTQIGGLVTLAGAHIGKMTAVGIQVGGDLIFSDGEQAAQIGQDLALRGARVNGSVQMDGVQLAGPVTMLGARIEGDLRLSRAHVSGTFTASDLDVRHDLALDRTRFDGEVNLFSARIGNSAHLEAAAFANTIIASGLHVSADLLASADFAGPVVLSAAAIGGTLDLRGASLTELDLTSTAIGGALQVDASTRWTGKSRLSLVNASAARLQDGAVAKSRTCPSDDAPPPGNGWPLGPTLELDGFTYGHIGAVAGQSGTNMRDRPPCWWAWWLSRDKDFSSQPYVQLASVMTAHGDQDKAADILYDGRVRETQLAWQAGNYLRVALLGMLYLVAGYGLGTHTFRVVLWILGFTAIGVILLTLSPAGAKRPIWWRIGASLHRALPGIEINKEFTDFFDDPDRTKLPGWQVVIFSAIVLVGWVFGLFLVAAMTGLTQHS